MGCNWTVKIVHNLNACVKTVHNFQGGDITLRNILNDIYNCQKVNMVLLVNKHCVKKLIIQILTGT